MPVYEFLTLTDSEASAIVDAFNGHWWDGDLPDLDARQAIALGLDDSAAEMDPKWDVDLAALSLRALALTPDQGSSLRDAIIAFWQSALPITKERLSQVGLV